MSFYHFLHSNAAQKRFSSNQAANFSIPIDDIQQLNGDWEVGVTQLVHSNCLYTFNHEILQIDETLTQAYQYEEGTRVYVPLFITKEHPSNIKMIYDFLNKAGKNIVKFTPTNSEHTTYSHIVDEQWIVALSPSLQNQFGYSTSSLTTYDKHPKNYVTKPSGKDKIVYKEKEFYVDLIPRNEKTLMKKIILKEKNSDLTRDLLMRRFNFVMQIDGKQVVSIENDLMSNLVTMTKVNDDDIVVEFSKYFRELFSYRFSAVHGKEIIKSLTFNSHHQYDKEWSVSIYKKGKAMKSKSLKRKILLPQILHSVKDGVGYLNEVIADKRIIFTESENVLSLNMRGENMQLSMDNTLMDILGFDQNVFYSNSITKASAPMSLTRRINYFQIYSNIGVDVRVGDTEAPLLAMIPFNPKDCSTLSERTFKKVNYINLKSNYMSQIDISMYDDAGALIPFHKDAVTSIVLHFRLKT